MSEQENHLPSKHKVDMSGEAILRRLETVSDLNELCRMLRESTLVTVREESDPYQTNDNVGTSK